MAIQVTTKKIFLKRIFLILVFKDSKMPLPAIAVAVKRNDNFAK